ncbi:MAG: very short patch repair endonuclease [Pseudomonadales bacterium]|nr:very short patch repair endonuclease [Pseudomonadales bacterium]
MTDIVHTKTRSRMMAGIKGKNTQPELLLRSELHRRGFRYRLHYKGLPGKPDIVLPKFQAIILVNGCFWHGHNCHLFKWPSTRPEFWRQKIEGNRTRDQRNLVLYRHKGWKTLVIWECALKGRSKIGATEVVEIAARWIQFDPDDAEIAGKRTGAS